MIGRVSTALVVLLCVGVWAGPAWTADKTARKKAKPAGKAAADSDSETAEKSAPAKEPEKKPEPKDAGENKAGDAEKLEVATFGQGCFWCAEAVFQQIKGVKSVVSGYSGGDVPNPTYEMVSTGLTGHAEVVEITFDPSVVSYSELLDVFWKSHDPTTLNQQGHDHGTQYRSIILYHSQEQKETAEKSKAKLKQARRVVTQIVEFSKFYPAEDYHQNYFKNNPENPYCYQQIRPKVMKVKKLFKDKVSKDDHN